MSGHVVGVSTGSDVTSAGSFDVANQ